MPSDKTSPFNEDGTLKPTAFKNLLVAMLLRSGGSVELTYQELEASNKRRFFYRANETGLEVTLIEQKEGTA